MAEISQQALAYVDKWLQYQFGNSRWTGVAVGIDDGHEVRYSKAFGKADLNHDVDLTADHYFRVASHSKMFTATAVMLLVEQGKLRLDDRTSDHLDWFRSHRDRAVAEVTIRQLLSHGAGLIRDGETSDYWETVIDFPTGEDLRAYISEATLILPSNERFKYSNFGYSYLGALIEVVSGQSYNEFVTEHIIRKLGLKQTGADITPEAISRMATGYSSLFFNYPRKAYGHIPTNGMSAATGFYSTVGDMCAFGRAHFMGNTTLLSDASKREMQHLQWKVEHEEEDYGLGFGIVSIGEAKFIGHSGGFPGYITRTYIDSKNQLVVTVLTNAQDGPASNIAGGIIKILQAFAVASAEPASEADLARFEGRFFNKWGATDVVLLGNRLVGVMPANWNPFKLSAKLKYVSDTELIIDEVSGYYSLGESIKYHFDDDGRISYVVDAGMKSYPWEEYKKRYIE